MKIVFYEHFYTMWAPYEPYLPPRKMMGAGESSFIYLSRELARLGHDVTVCCHTEHEGEYDGVRWTKEHVAQADVAISGETAEGLELVDVGLSIVDCQCNDPKLKKHWPIVNLVVARSHWHGSAIEKVTKGWDWEKIKVIGNGVDLAQYDGIGPNAREPYKMIWASSPDRGLHHLLRFFPAIKRVLPEATLHIYYAFEPCFEPIRWAMNVKAENLWRAKRMMESTPGVFYHGGVARDELIEAQRTASLLCYPCDTPRWSEGFCVSLMEACAAGLPVLTSDCDAIPEVYGDSLALLPLPIKDDDWVEIAVDMLRNPTSYSQYVDKGRELAGKHDWSLIAKQWVAMINFEWKLRYGEEVT